jgi:hypothetical protein
VALAEFAERVEEEHGRRRFRCLFGICSEYMLRRTGVKQRPGLVGKRFFGGLYMPVVWKKFVADHKWDQKFLVG